MNTMIKRIVLFSIINFAILGMSGLFTPGGIASDWYQLLDKAPWTPPGWFFGFAWTTIMIFLSLFMAFALKEKNAYLVKWYVIQLFLNVIWTPVFFYLNLPVLGLLVIISLALVVGMMIVKFYKNYRALTFLLLPYFMWLCVATSLNLYIVLYN